MCKKRVLITGFGPYGGVPINPSWEGVNYMNQKEIESKYNITFFREKISVEYAVVDQSVPKLWNKYLPDLTIHVGASGSPCFLLETVANKEKYNIPDICNTCPVDFKHWSDGPTTICTDLDVDLLCKEFNKDPPIEQLRAKKSCDAGRYLCEYTYYTSLACGRTKTLFVHVPAVGCSYELIAKGLERVLAACLAQLTD